MAWTCASATRSQRSNRRSCDRDLTGEVIKPRPTVRWAPTCYRGQDDKPRIILRYGAIFHLATGQAMLRCDPARHAPTKVFKSRSSTHDHVMRIGQVCARSPRHWKACAAAAVAVRCATSQSLDTVCRQQCLARSTPTRADVSIGTLPQTSSTTIVASPGAVKQGVPSVRLGLGARA